MARKRPFTVFSLSFLDVMSCGFGAVVLIFLIINHATEREFEVVNEDLLAEIRKLDFEVDRGELNRTELREKIDATQRRLDDATKRRLDISEILESEEIELAELDALALARKEHLNQLKTDVDTRQKEVERLQAAEEEDEGDKARTFVGEGDRQYLTGLKVGGNRILIALDKSASMLDETIVNVIRRRNMGDSRKREAPKWKRAVATVEWLVAQLPLEAQFQVYAFDVEAESLLEDAEWSDVASADDLEAAITATRELTPGGGTSLENMFNAIHELEPLPDNIYLIIDSLPTQGTKPPRGSTISGRKRSDLFWDAERRLPPNIPVNVILFPMEGDPAAAASYWSIAQNSGGAFLSPSKDWP
jgi:hypothetical protein